jgi:hypothetical protein
MHLIVFEYFTLDLQFFNYIIFRVSLIFLKRKLMIICV